MGMEGLAILVAGAFTEETLFVGRSTARNIRQIGRGGMIER
jgi:hypothetical protein